jgi:hypothetical protein
MPLNLSQRSSRTVRVLLAAALLGTGASASAAARADEFDARIEDALAKAGANRAQIESFLARAAQTGDAQKRDAARWLVANMDGHGFAEIRLVAKDGAVLPYDAVDYKSFAEAKAALDAIEKSHPGADFQKTRFDSDLEHASADFLMTHLDGAFDAWRTLPWAKPIRYEVFRECILPYRGSNEPLSLWRNPARERLAALCTENAGESDVRAFGEKVRAQVHPWVGFTDLFYLHPTDQSYDEMCARRLGRCEDITNMVSFGMRSVAAMCASDYTPWWAASDNNHAWEVVLDAEGNGRAGLAGRAAKVYRKTFAHQPNSLAAIKRVDEVVPKWLGGSHYVDVTAQYQPTSDVTVALGGVSPETLATHRFAYLAVFNGGAWRPIHWGAIEDGKARFDAMGRNIAYLPMLHAKGSDIPAGEPFVLDVDGVMHPLAGASISGARLEAGADATLTKPDIQDPDTGVVKARTVVKGDSAYELFVWRAGGWKSLGRREAGEAAHAFEGFGADALLWLVEDGSGRLERIFTIDGGKQVFW